MTDAYLASSDSAAMGRLRYAEACLKQGMSYQAASQASDVCEADLKDFAPGYGPAHRDAPVIIERTALGRCAAILPYASPEELSRIAALALRLLCSSSGLQTVREVCANTIRAMPDNRVSPRDRLLDIVDGIAEAHGVTRAEIMGQGRVSRISRARQACYAALRGEGISYPSLARFFSRDHTTILYGIRAHKARVAAEAGQ